MSEHLLSLAEGRAFLSAHAHAARADLDRSLRAYFLLMTDATRARRSRLTETAGLCAVELEALGEHAVFGEAAACNPAYRPLAARCFRAAEALAVLAAPNGGGAA